MRRENICHSAEIINFLRFGLSAVAFWGRRKWTNSAKTIHSVGFGASGADFWGVPEAEEAPSHHLLYLRLQTAHCGKTPNITNWLFLDSKIRCFDQVCFNFGSKLLKWYRNRAQCLKQVGYKVSSFLTFKCDQDHKYPSLKCWHFARRFHFTIL